METHAISATTPSPAVVEAVQAFVDATTPADSRRVLEAHRAELLGDEADGILASLHQQHLGDERSLRMVEGWRGLLADARRTGLDEAYERRRRLDDIGGVLEAWAAAGRGGAELAGLCREAVELVDAERQPVSRAFFQGQLGAGLADGAGGDRRAELDEAIAVLGEAASVFWRGGLDLPWVQAQHELARAALARGELTGSADARARDVELAAAALTEAGSMLMYRDRRESLPSVDGAVAALEQALALTPRSSPAWPRRSFDVGLARSARYPLSSDLADLDAAIDAVRPAAASEQDEAELALFLSDLSVLLNDRYNELGRPEDIEEAVAAQERALARTEEDSDRVDGEGKLGVLLHSRFHVGHELADLERSLELIRGAAERSAEGSEARAQWQANLAVGLRTRFETLGDATDLDEAAEALAGALAAADLPAPVRALRLYNAGLVSLSRYELSREDADFAAARSALEGSLGLLPEDARLWPTCQQDLGVALRRRFEASRDVDALREGIEHLRLAANRVPAGSREAARLDGNLAGCFRLLGEALGERRWLDEAIDRLTRARKNLPDGSREWATYTYDLAVTLQARFALDADRSDREAAVEAATGSLAPFTPQSWPEHVVMCARLLGDLQVHGGEWEAAAATFDLGLEALDALYRRQLLRGTREAWLRKAGAIHLDAAYAHARAGDVETAVATLEHGRARISSDALARDRADLTGLRDLGRDDLVERYAAAAAHLAALEQSQGEDELRAAGEALEEAIAAIRTVAGYERFLRPLTFADVSGAATGAPLAYLASAETGGAALIVDPSGAVAPVWLPELADAPVRSRVVDYLQTYAVRSHDPAAWATSLEQTTRWLWDALMGPLLEALAPAPRATLVPAGLLGLLPLHAAWTPDPDDASRRRYALDELLLTYAPNARALEAAAQAAERLADDGLLAVEDPRPVSAGDLPAADVEVDAVLDHVPRSLRLRGEEATRAAVVDAIAQYPLVHFACHGTADLFHPLESSLLLANDERLTLAELLEQRLRVRVAVLSACETGIPGVSLPDEVVNLPSGLLQAGAAGVVATFWAVTDASTAALMARVYELWQRDGLEPAEALRQAQRWLRDASNGEKHDRFPAIGELAGGRVPEAARSLWESAHAHAHPRFWAPFYYVGV